MSLNINKRLRYFNTEAEYLAYVEAQRAAAEAGTLELMETTVCCIKHNDDTTPDEYHPSTEAGYTDVVFNYNENDDIRYVPFINPMWTARLCTVYPIKDTEGIVVGYKPVLYQNTELPDVIDGQQFTAIDNEFTTKLLTRWPAFSVTNVESLSFKPYIYNPRFILPSTWNSLKTINISAEGGYNRSRITVPKFGENDILEAPNLESFSWTNTNSSFGNDYPSDFTYFPVINSNKLISFAATFYHSDPNGTALDFDTILPNTSSLTTLNIRNSNSPTQGSGLHTIKLTHTGPSLSFPGSIYLKYVDGTLKDIHIDIVTQAESVYFNTLDLCCDFNTSSCLCNIDPKRLTITGCLSTSPTLKSFGSYITHSNTQFNIFNPSLSDINANNTVFKNVSVTFPASSTPNSSKFLRITPATTGQSLTIKLLDFTSMYFNNSISQPIPFQKLTLDLSENPYTIVLTNTHFKVAAEELEVIGTFWVGSTAYGQIYPNYQVNQKYTISELSSATLKVDGYWLRYFKPTSAGLDIKVTQDVQTGISCALYPQPQKPGGIPITTPCNGHLDIDVQAEFPTLSIEVSNAENYNLKYIKINAVVDTLNISTITGLLDGLNSIYNDHSQAFSDSDSVISIHRVLYNQLSSNYIDIINHFYLVNIVET